MKPSLVEWKQTNYKYQKTKTLPLKPSLVEWKQRLLPLTLGESASPLKPSLVEWKPNTAQTFVGGKKP